MKVLKHYEDERGDMVKVQLDNGKVVNITYSKYKYLQELNSYETRYRNILKEEVDDRYAEIVEEYYYDDGTPNGWVQIKYKVDKFNRTIPVDEW